MSLAMDNIDVLRHGWEDAVSTVTPDLPQVRATMEDEFTRAVADARLDEASLLEAVRGIVAVASKTGGADNARLLGKALHRTVYEYLLSLDALTLQETVHIEHPQEAADRSRLIGFEEVAELEQRQAAIAEEAAAATVAEPADQATGADTAEVVDETAAAEPPPPEQAALHDGGAHYRPRFRLFRRGDHHGEEAGSEPFEPELPGAGEGTAPPRNAPAPPPLPQGSPPAPPPAPEWWRGPAVPPALEPIAQEATVAPLAEAIAEIAGENDDRPEDEVEPPTTFALRELAQPNLEPSTTEAQPNLEPSTTMAQPNAEPPTTVAQPHREPPTTWRVREPEPEILSPAADLAADGFVVSEADLAAGRFEAAEPDLAAEAVPPQAEPSQWAVPETATGLGALEAWAAGTRSVDPNDGFTTTFAPEPSGGNGVAHEQQPFTVAPREGFHLTDDDDFFIAPAERQETHAAPPAPTAGGDAPSAPSAELQELPPAVHDTAPAQQQRPAPAPQSPADDGAQRKGWHVRRNSRSRADAPAEVDAGSLAEMLDADEDDQAEFLDLNPFVVEARNEINDRLRRRRCDEAASLLQRIAGEVGGRGVAELALDAGDRCRALGKANAALSCYIAASRADPVFEAPLLRLADICLDDRDVDLAVSYLDRVARLHRMRGDTRGALRLYRKIATIAPYRDDILATLMRANSTGQFED